MNFNPQSSLKLVIAVYDTCKLDVEPSRLAAPILKAAKNNVNMLSTLRSNCAIEFKFEISVPAVPQL